MFAVVNKKNDITVQLSKQLDDCISNEAIYILQKMKTFFSDWYTLANIIIIYTMWHITEFDCCIFNEGAAVKMNFEL